MKSVMVLGINFAQKDYLAYLKSAGFRVLAASNAESGPGSLYVDAFYRQDISQVEILSKICIAESVDFVYSIGSAFALPFVNRISELIHKPHFMTFNDVLVTHKKDEMRVRLGQDNAYNIRFQKSRTIDDVDWEVFPCIIKPTDSQAQRGVRIAHSKDDIQPMYNESMSYALNGTVILEEFISGQEFSTNIYVVNGEIRIMVTTKRISFSEYPGGIIKEHIWEDIKYEWNDQLLEAAYQIINRFGILNGPLYIQFIVTEDQKLRIVEFTPRLDGCHLWRLVEYITGINLMHLATLHLLGACLELEKVINPIVGKRFKLEFFTTKPNIVLEARDLEGLSTRPTDIYSELYYEVGERVPVSNGFVEKVGYQITELL